MIKNIVLAAALGAATTLAMASDYKMTGTLSTGGASVAGPAAASTSALPAPQQVLEKSSQELLAIAKTDKEIASGNRRHIVELVEQKVVPLMDFDRITAEAAGRHWRGATPEQQVRLKAAFTKLLVNTYSSAVASLRDKQITFAPARMSEGDDEVIVKSKVADGTQGSLDMTYRMERRGTKWLVFDVNIMGAWLVESYKSSFNSEIARSGMDGLIKALEDKNARIAEKSSK